MKINTLHAESNRKKERKYHEKTILLFIIDRKQENFIPNPIKKTIKNLKKPFDSCSRLYYNVIVK